MASPVVTKSPCEFTLLMLCYIVHTERETKALASLKWLKIQIMESIFAFFVSASANCALKIKRKHHYKQQHSTLNNRAHMLLNGWLLMNEAETKAPRSRFFHQGRKFSLFALLMPNQKERKAPWHVMERLIGKTTQCRRFLCCELKGDELPLAVVVGTWMFVKKFSTRTRCQLHAAIHQWNSINVPWGNYD